MARIPYVTLDELPDESLIESSAPPESLDPDYQHLMSTRNRNSYRAIGHLPPVLKVFRDLVESIKTHGGLSTLEQELIILCCAREIPSKYEWHNHARIALNAGISAETICAVATETYDEFSPAHTALLNYIPRFLTGTVDDDHHDDLATHYDTTTLVAINLFAGYWLMNARVVDALNVEIEEPFIGWELEHL